MEKTKKKKKEKEQGGRFFTSATVLKLKMVEKYIKNKFKKYAEKAEKARIT